MAKQEPIGNSARTAEGFRVGDFVQLSPDNPKPMFAIVTDVDSGAITVTHFEDGFPFSMPRTPIDYFVRKSSKDDVLAHFSTICDRFERGFEEGGLSGAVSVRKQHYLNGVISQLKDPLLYTIHAATIPPPDPMTGVYVLMGVYTEQGLVDRLEGLVVVPRLTEDTVSMIMKAVYPNGFGGILSNSSLPYEASHNALSARYAFSNDPLCAYKAYEVPEKALNLVKNPKKLDLRLRQGRLTGDF